MSIATPSFFGLHLHEIFFSSPWLSVKVHLFTRAVGREGHCKQISVACVGSTRSVPATLGLPPLVECVLSPSTLLRLQAALQGVGPELGALPRPKLLRFRFWGYSTKAQTQLGLCFVTSLVWAAQAARSLVSALSSGAARILPSPSQPWLPDVLVWCALCLSWLAATLPGDVNHSEFQEVFG